MKHLFLGSFATGPPVVNEDDERHESAAHHCCDQHNGCPVQAVRDGVEGSLRQIAKNGPSGQRQRGRARLFIWNVAIAAMLLVFSALPECQRKRWRSR